jgi:hypothetical protein
MEGNSTKTLTPGAKMVDCKIYPLNPSEQKQLDKFLKEQLVEIIL